MSEICAICRTDLSGTPIHTLQECGHTFHVECAILWFRSPRDIYVHPRHQHELGIPGTCPLCRSPPDRKYHFATRRARVKILRKLSRKNTTPDVIKKAFKKEKQLRDKEQQSILALRGYRKEYRDILAKGVRLRRQRWKAQTRVCEIHDQIACFDPHVLLEDVTILFN